MTTPHNDFQKSQGAELPQGTRHTTIVCYIHYRLKSICAELCRCNFCCNLHTSCMNAIIPAPLEYSHVHWVRHTIIILYVGYDNARWVYTPSVSAFIGICLYILARVHTHVYFDTGRQTYYLNKPYDHHLASPSLLTRSL